MKGDFSRDTFTPARHFSRVLMQQGRVQLDADWNEQSDIVLYYLRTLAKDLIGDHGGPGVGFSIGVGVALKMDFAIWPGHYYVDGILCENEADNLTYTSQSGYPFPDSGALQTNKNHLVYLDVWERHVTALENDAIREVALGGVDTATRTQVMWQVKATTKLPDGSDIVGDQTTDWSKWLQDTGWSKWVDLWQPPNRGQLKASTKEDAGMHTSPCIMPPQVRYRGAENQLYRIEIHRGGNAWDGTKSADGKPAGNAQTAATFKWSRDNGSVVFPIVTLSGKMASLANLGRDDRLTLKPNDWVEIADDDCALKGQPGPMAQVLQVDSATRTVTFAEDVAGLNYDETSTKHPLLRRWDHQAGDPTEGGLELSEGAALIKEDNNNWLLLEDGVQIQFKPSTTGSNRYDTGDYWLIPARTATGDVEWPQIPNPSYNPLDPHSPKTVADARPPHGIHHHYAPLAIVGIDAAGTAWMAGFRRSI